MLLNPHRFGGAPAAVSLQNNSFSNSGFSSYSIAFPVLASDCLLVVGFGCRHVTARNISTVVVDGDPATPLIELEGIGECSAGLYAVPMAAGRSGNAVINLSGAVDRGGAGIWAVTGLQSFVPTDVKSAGDVTNPAVNAVVSAGGVIIGYSYVSAASAGTWTGINEDFDDALSGPNGSSGGSLAFALGDTVSVQRSDTGTSGERLVVASFR